MIECYEGQCPYHHKDEPFCSENECQRPDWKSCPYCGRFVPEDTIIPPADYCSHDIGE